VADDHQVVRTGFAALLDTQPDFTVIGTACDGADAVRICRELDRPHGRPDAGHAPDRLPNSLLAVRELEVGVLIRVLTLCTSSQGNRSNIATITHHSTPTVPVCIVCHASCHIGHS
jgi:hypothetical protein